MSGERLQENYELERVGEACGVFGVYAPDQPTPQLAYLGLEAINHRGQQGAGISTSNGEELAIYNDLGLVKEVFEGGKQLTWLHPNDEAIISSGHTWYGTSETPRNIQRRALQPMPFSGEGAEPMFALSHNGDIKQLEEAADRFDVDLDSTVSDSEGIKEIIGAAYLKYGDLTDALADVLPDMDGAYSLVLSTEDQMIGARDRHGFRPLHLGRISEGQGGWVLASEVPALQVVGAEPVREIEPGEIVTITGPGEEDITSTRFAEAEPSVCSFEFVYFSRPDNKIMGQSVSKTRRRMGELLAERDTVEADIVLGVPNSGNVAAGGYAWKRGIPKVEGIVKNQYIDRSFIAESPDKRRSKVRKKLNVSPDEVAGQRCIVVDDSVVRGTTQKELTGMLREAGATEVHLRLTSMPYKWPCIYGMDTGRPEELIANRMSIEEIKDYLGVDSIEYLTNDEMQDALGVAAGKVCTACTTKVYPTEVPVELKSKIFPGE